METTVEDSDKEAEAKERPTKRGVGSIVAETLTKNERIHLKYTLVKSEGTAKSLKEARWILGMLTDNYKLLSRRGVAKTTVGAKDKWLDTCKKNPHSHDQGAMPPHIWMPMSKSITALIGKDEALRAALGEVAIAAWTEMMDKIRQPIDC